MNNLPVYISLVFGLTTFLTVFIFCRATANFRVSLIILLSWLALQTILGLSGFYKVTDTIPPRFFLLLVPPLLLIFGMFITRNGLRYIDSLDIKWLTILHTVRVLVELVLFWLFINKTVPRLMTFEGRNFDILSGITAPIVYYLGFIKNKLSNKILLVWNFICLGLLCNIVIHAVLSAPFVFQKFAFDQPNIALLHFPFVWLPCCVVPLVLFAHLATIRQLINRQPKTIKGGISINITHSQSKPDNEWIEMQQKINRGY